MKLFVLILSVVLLFSLSACDNSPRGSSGGSTSKNQSHTENTTKNSDKNSSSNNSSNNSTQSSNTNANSSNANQGNEETFYGQWQIKKVIGFGPAGTYSTEDIKTLTGKQLTFSKDSATCFGDKIEDMNNTVMNPVYNKTVIAKNNFQSDYRVTFDQLGINGDSVTEIDATGTKGICTVLFSTPGNNMLILYSGGTFFELDHFSNQNNSTPSDEQAINRPTGAWVDTFEKELYKGYHVTPSRYKNIGNGNWEVWVKEINTGDNPYVTVNQNTGNFHG